MQARRAPRRDVGARIFGVEHQHRETFVAFEIIAIERAEGKMPGLMPGDVLRRRDGKRFEISAVKLNNGIAGAKRKLGARHDGKSQSRIVRTHGLEIVAGEH